MSVPSSMTLVIGLPAPCPAFVSIRINRGFFWNSKNISFLNEIKNKSIRKKLGKYQRILLYSYTISNLPCNKKSAKSIKIQCLKKHVLKNLLNTFKKYIKENPFFPKLLLPFQIKIICVNSRGSNPSYLKTLSIYLSLHVVWHKYEKQILNNNFFSYNSFSSS